MDDDAAFDLMVSENLRRRDILPSEEGEAFKKILDREYGMAYSSGRFGKSDSFIHGRLCLVRLIPGVAGMPDAGEISGGAAVEISRPEPEIQEHILNEHPETGIAFNSWKHLPVKLFKERPEAAYTVLLSRFPFDRSECAGCAYNSEIHSLFPVPENSRRTGMPFPVRKHEKHLLDRILAAAGEENLDVYVSDGNIAGIHAEIIGRLAEPGIEAKTGHVYPMPGNPVMPGESDFEGDGAGYGRAMQEFDTKRSNRDALQGLIGSGAARKVIVIKDLEAAAGYVMTVRKNENESGDGSRSIPPGAEGSHAPDDVPNRPSAADGAGHPSVKPDLPAAPEQKDRKNRGEALCRVIGDAKKPVKSVDIPPAPLTPFEDALLYCIMPAFPDFRHDEFFGIPEGKSVPEEIKLNLYGSLTDEQKNTLKRDFLIENMVRGNGSTKKAALLIELAKRHFPDEMAEIENTHNEEYLKNRLSSVNRWKNSGQRRRNRKIRKKLHSFIRCIRPRCSRLHRGRIFSGFIFSPVQKNYFCT